MSRMIDIEYIKKWVNISEEELMQRLVKDAVGLMDEARENARIAIIKERKSDTYYDIAFIKDFFSGYSYFSKWFSDEEILEAVKNHMGKDDLTQKQKFRGDISARPGVRPIKHGNYEFDEYRGRWTRKVNDFGTECLISNQYQGVNGAPEVARELLEKRCPWTKDYSIKIYELTSYGNDWIFFETPKDECEGSEYCNKSFYVPYSALMDSDVDAVLTTHSNYWSSYNKSDTTEFIKSDFVQGIVAHIKEA